MWGSKPEEKWHNMKIIFRDRDRINSCVWIEYFAACTTREMRLRLVGVLPISMRKKPKN
jgi:hypothetical protein